MNTHFLCFISRRRACCFLCRDVPRSNALPCLCNIMLCQRRFRDVNAARKTIMNHNFSAFRFLSIGQILILPNPLSALDFSVSVRLYRKQEVHTLFFMLKAYDYAILCYYRTAVFAHSFLPMRHGLLFAVKTVR